VAQYLGFKERVADSQELSDVNPKYWATAMAGGVFFEIWPLEKGRAPTSPPFGVQSTLGPLGPDYLHLWGQAI
jgi:hypothetical protein